MRRMHGCVDQDVHVDVRIGACVVETEEPASNVVRGRTEHIENINDVCCCFGHVVLYVLHDGISGVRNPVLTRARRAPSHINGPTLEDEIRVPVGMSRDDAEPLNTITFRRFSCQFVLDGRKGCESWPTVHVHAPTCQWRVEPHE